MPRAPRSKLARNEQEEALTHALTRMAFAHLHGFQYDDDRDIYRVAGYPKALTHNHFVGLYERDGVAGTIVDKPAETTWRVAPDVAEVDGEGQAKESAFSKAFKELAKKHRLWNRLERVDKLARRGRYAVLFIGARDSGTDADFRRPLGSLTGPKDILYLSAYPEEHAAISTWITDPKDERFGQPETYTIQFSANAGQTGFRANNGLVHWSRVIHVAEELLSDEVYGRPALQRVYNDLHDLLKVSASTGEAFWQRVAGILQAVVDNAKDTRGLTTPELDKLDKDLQEIYHNLRRTFMGQGVKLERLASDEPQPTEAAKLFMQKIAAGSIIPMRMLFGSETGERASSEDQKAYFGTIMERQVQHAEPMVLRPLVDRLIAAGALPRPAGNEYHVTWPSLVTLSEAEMAAANKQRADTAAALTPVGSDPLELVEIDEDRNVWLKPHSDKEPARDIVEPPPVPAPGVEGPPTEV